jgi:hypothetical protein
LVLAAAPAAFAAGPKRQDGLHDARYCEVIEVHGLPPTASATVWNTIGLGTCPQAKFAKLDARKLAEARGDTLVVLNGPRHWVLDSASGTVGAEHAFGGMRMRKVATIPLRRAADLATTPYTDRVIRRHTSWRWKRGRTVFELVAPGGDVYVMQSYAQIVDPKLSLAKLRRLGPRLTLPQGWRYRARTLRHPLVLKTRSQATIVQDDLKNTYQLARTVPRGRRTEHAIHIAGKTRTVKFGPGGAVEDRGRVTGAPFGAGRIVLDGSLAGGHLTATFRILYAHGSVVGTAAMPFTVADGKIHFRGTSRFTGGTGAYRGITSGALTSKDDNTLDGQNGRVSVRGTARYGRVLGKKG